MGLECILVPGICVVLSPVRPGFVGPAGLRLAGGASSGPPGFVGPAGLRRARPGISRPAHQKPDSLGPAGLGRAHNQIDFCTSLTPTVPSRGDSRFPVKTNILNVS